MKGRSSISGILRPEGAIATWVCLISVAALTSKGWLTNVLAGLAAAAMMVSVALGMWIAAQQPAPTPWKEKSLLLARMWSACRFVGGAAAMAVGAFVAIAVNEAYADVRTGRADSDEFLRFVLGDILAPAVMAGVFVASLWLWFSVARLGAESRATQIDGLVLWIRPRFRRLARHWATDLTHPLWMFLSFYLVPLALVTIPMVAVS